jgi:hypothetical protein
MRATDHRGPFAAVVVCACWAASCTQSTPPPPPAGDAQACAVVPGFGCGNAVDATLLPILSKDGVTPVLASDGELCRRYAIDLTGVIPSFADYQKYCLGKSPGAMVDHFMNLDGYVRVNQRYWADAFLYDNQDTWYQYIADLDAQVASLYRGEINYPDFVAIAVAHPAFVSKFGGENAVGYAYENFLGRQALPVERQDLLGLYRTWRRRPASDPALAYTRYGTCNNASDCDVRLACTNGYCIERSNYIELYVDPTNCAGPLGGIACSSTMTGASAILQGVAPTSLADLTPAQWETLRTPGRVIANLPGFWETAADTVLKKYTGWWMAGTTPADEVPAVRASLAAFFRRTAGDVRALERQVLTSAFYTMAATPQDPNDSVPWHRGPTKPMAAEVWLDSVGAVVGANLGSCDWRYPNTSPRSLPPALVPAQGQIDGFSYADAARVLGGCPDHVSQLRTTNSGVLMTIQQREVLAQVCASRAATAIVGAPDAPALVRRFWRPAFLEEPNDGEVAAIAATLPNSGSATAVALCQLLPRTNPFLFY